jgi:hypothetical protein
MGLNSSIVRFGFIVAMGVTVAAQQGGPVPEIPPAPELKYESPWRPSTALSTETRVIGSVIDTRQVPVAGANVRLRDIHNGAVLQEAKANEVGEYAFSALEPSTYVVEMVLIGGHVVALSNAGSLARYETLQTVIQLPGRWDAAGANVVMGQNVADFAGMSAALTMTAATLTMAVDANISPADPGESVSPTNVSDRRR